MKNIIIALIAFISLTTLKSVAGEDAINIAQFKGGRKAAIALTFDDGTIDHFTTAAPLLEKYGFHGTFFIVISWIKDNPKNRLVRRDGWTYMTWDECRKLAESGHEIGNHSMTHYQLTKAKSIDDAKYEVIAPLKVFEEKLNVHPVSFCYPGNSRNAELEKIVLDNHIAHTTSRYFYGGKKFNLEKANAWIDQAINDNKSVVAMIHAIKKGIGYAPFEREQDFEDHLAYIKKYEDDIWVDTLGNLAKYNALKNDAKIEVLSSSEQETKIKLTTTLDTALYNVPLTLMIPRSMSVIKVIQNGKTLAVSSAAKATLAKPTMVDVYADGTTITITHK